MENQKRKKEKSAIRFLYNLALEKTSTPTQAQEVPLCLAHKNNAENILNYIPLSEARKVALYMLFFTFGDSLSKTAIVVICPFTGSIFSQLAGSDNFVYL